MFLHNLNHLFERLSLRVFARCCPFHFSPPSSYHSEFNLQCVIEANIFPVLIEILAKGDFKSRKEAAWAITNATSGGSPEQIMYLVEMVCTAVPVSLYVLALGLLFLSSGCKQSCCEAVNIETFFFLLSVCDRHTTLFVGAEAIVSFRFNYQHRFFSILYSLIVNSRCWFRRL